jgi:hypothetical protein
MRSVISGIQIPTDSRINIDGGLTLDSLAGTSGQVLTSAGAGNTPTWTTISGGGSGFTGAGTSITGITATATSGSATVTASNITISGGSATTSSNAIGDNATGGNLNIISGGATFSGTSQGNATSGDLNLNVSTVSSGAAGTGYLGQINIGTANAQNLYLDANAGSVGSVGSVTLGTSGANIYIGNSASNGTIDIGSGTSKQSNTTRIVSSLTGSSVHTASIYMGWNNSNTTQIRLGTDSNTLSTTYMFGKVLFKQPTPTTTTTARLLTAPELLTFIVINSTATTGNLQLPTPANMDTNVQSIYTDVAFDWSVINTAASGSVTVTANGSHTVVGNMVVTFNTSAAFRTRRSAATPAYVTYRIS